MSQHRWTWTLHTTFPSRLGEHSPFIEQILSELQALGWKDRDYFAIQMALEESLTNAIRHGNCHDESKVVQLECKLNEEHFWLRVTDQGPGFQLATVPDCTADENLECPGGRGLALIRAFMTQVKYNETGNSVTMEKVRSPQ